MLTALLLYDNSLCRMPPCPFHTCTVESMCEYTFFCSWFVVLALTLGEPHVSVFQSPQQQMGVLMTGMYADPQVLTVQTHVETILTDSRTSDASSTKIHPHLSSTTHESYQRVMQMISCAHRHMENVQIGFCVRL